MRLNWYWRGIDVIDVEVHANRIAVAVFTPRDDDEVDQGPSLQAAGFLPGSEISVDSVDLEARSRFGFSA